jgi:hypothetical protein
VRKLLKSVVSTLFWRYCANDDPALVELLYDVKYALEEVAFFKGKYKDGVPYSDAVEEWRVKRELELG